MENPNLNLLAEVASFLAKTDMKPTTFSMSATGDPNFYNDLKDGREPRFITVRKVREYMERYGDASCG